jgi:hypothetical protein
MQSGETAVGEVGLGCGETAVEIREAATRCGKAIEGNCSATLDWRFDCNYSAFGYLVWEL